MKMFTIYRGFDRDNKALLMRASNMKAALSAARNRCAPHCPVVTIRDVLGGLRGEFHMRNERQGEFGREWDVIEILTK